MADITVKNLSKNAKLILAQKAKKAGLSQNKYICKLLETHVLVDEIEGVQSDYSELLKMCLATIEKNTDVMNEFIKMNQ